MLVLSRLVGEDCIITVGDKRIVVRLVETRHGKARLGFNADADVHIHRREIQEAIDFQKKSSEGFTKALGAKHA